MESLKAWISWRWGIRGYANVSDIYPLVENDGFGSGDHIDMRWNELDLTSGSEDMNNINTLIDRGVEVDY